MITLEQLSESGMVRVHRVDADGYLLLDAGPGIDTGSLSAKPASHPRALDACGRAARRHDSLSAGRATYATSRSFCASARDCSFFSDWFSIWRMRSRVTLNVRPTSSSVRGCSPPKPYRSSSTRRSR